MREYNIFQHRGYHLEQAQGLVPTGTEGELPQLATVLRKERKAILNQATSYRAYSVTIEEALTYPSMQAILGDLSEQTLIEKFERAYPKYRAGKESEGKEAQAQVAYVNYRISQLKKTQGKLRLNDSVIGLSELGFIDIDHSDITLEKFNEVAPEWVIGTAPSLSREHMGLAARKFHAVYLRPYQITLDEQHGHFSPISTRDSIYKDITSLLSMEQLFIANALEPLGIKVDEALSAPSQHILALPSIGHVTLRGDDTKHLPLYNKEL